ncbi:MAG: ABC transporter ATP-binding protein [Gammaproteobacteria bacterium]
MMSTESTGNAGSIQVSMVGVDNLAKVYWSGSTRQVVFDRLTFSVRQGETVALLGASGSGKTTLLNLISGIDRPDSGKVSLDGVDVHALAEPERTLLRRRRIGFVFQFFNLIQTLTVGENIALPLELLGDDNSAAQQRAAELLEAVGLGGLGHRFPETLSGGEQQRAAIARALVHRPDLLLADEPTGNLDEDSAGRIIELLTGLARRQGTTMLLVTHSTRVAQAADRVLRLSHGHLATD